MQNKLMLQTRHTRLVLCTHGDAKKQLMGRESKKQQLYSLPLTLPNYDMIVSQWCGSMGEGMVPQLPTQMSALPPYSALVRCLFCKIDGQHH